MGTLLLKLRMYKLLVWLFVMFSFVWVSYASDLNIEIANASQKFEKDYWKFDCSINWTPVSLWALSYALAINEWGYKKWTVGYTTNNWWSLHHKQVKEIKWTTCADWVCTRPIYNTVEDWLYDKLYLITHKKMYNGCNFWFNQLFGYIVWPKANPDSQYSPWITKRQYVNKRLKQLKEQALKYDWPIYNPSLDENIDWYNKSCRWVGNVEANEYVQIDTWIGQLWQMIFPKQKSKLFICNS